MIKEVLESLTSFHFRCGCVKVSQDGRIVAVVVPELWQHFSERNPGRTAELVHGLFLLLRQWLIFFFLLPPLSCVVPSGFVDTAG